MALDQVDVDSLDKEEAEMSFLDHLEALRWHLVRSVVAILVIAIISFIADDFVIQTLLYGPKEKWFPTYQFICGISEDLCFYCPEFKLNQIELGEVFFTHIKISIIFGFIVAFPYVFWEVWRFVKPALHDDELKAARGIVFTCSTLFLFGVLFGYFIIAPFATTFLTNYSLNLNVDTTTSMASYSNYIIMYTLPTGLVFELPLVMYFLTKVGLVTPEFLKTYRRHAAVIILVMAAIITPPDVMTQFLIGVPLYFLYEVSIIISRRVLKKEAEKEKTESITKT